MRRGLLGSTIAAFLASAWPAAAAADGPAGRWLTADGKGVIEIFACPGGLCGKIVWLADPLDNGRPRSDVNNRQEDQRKRPICGLVILGDFKPAGANAWDGGWIYNPENGKSYHAEMALAGPDRLNLRGYIGIPLFGETQSWTRADPKLIPCTGG